MNPDLQIFVVADSTNKWLQHAGASEVVHGDEVIADEIITKIEAAVAK